MDRIWLHRELNENQLADIYETARREGVLGLVAFDVGEVGEEYFFAFARRAEVFGAGFDERGRPLGFFYLSHFEGRTARLHFCLFEAGRAERRELGRRVIGWCFEVLGLECLVGVIPALNLGARRYAREMGGRELGIIPGLCWMERLSRAVGGVQFLFLKGDDLWADCSGPRPPSPTPRL